MVASTINSYLLIVFSFFRKNANRGENAPVELTVENYCEQVKLGQKMFVYLYLKSH